ncbi:MAG TPA: nicotinamide-nucleotide amidohydrolase family protein, partial [Thermoanaerobaculia bacterium]|nr:nicotinamide-nucleotide amidohydrolase family protein [Thermoanaerobaculia bacterium]
SAKQAILDVDPGTLRRHGAVSEEAAREMARGARARFDSDLAVAVTGIAGPDGGTAEKPVGTVYFALSARDGREIAKKRLYGGDRTVVRRASAMFALDLVRRFVTGEQ